MSINALCSNMSESTFNTISTTLSAGSVIALLLAVISFVAMIARWKTPNRRRHVIRLIVASAMLVCLIGIQYAVLFLVYLPSIGDQQMAEFDAARADTLATTSVVRVGDSAPQFSLTTADGETFSLADTAGDVVLINFFATWCGPCQAELPHVEEIWATRKDDDHFNLLVIGREETTESVQEFRKNKGFSFPIAADPDRNVYSLFASELIPRTIVISSDGTIVYSRTGFHEDDLTELDAILDKHLALAH